MTTTRRQVVLCSCEDTMAIDTRSIARAIPDAVITTARHLCGPDATFQRLATNGELLVACTAMRHVFEQIAEDAGLAANLLFANVRETAGWAAEGAAAGPKMAALLAAAAVPDEPAPMVTFESTGITLICGRDEQAIAAAEQIGDRLDVTVLLLPGADVTPPRNSRFPVRQGRVKSLKGHLGAFEITIDDYAAPRPSSRARFVFGAPRSGAVSKADIVIDLTGEAPMLAAPALRRGYLRADPANDAAVAPLLLEAVDLSGTFDQPRAISFRADLCAHSRSRIVGCRRCLDLCPAGAIAPAGNHVAIDPHVCAGCGQCAAACPTGAAAYALPTAERLMSRIRAALLAYAAAGGQGAQLVLHDTTHGAALIDALARQGDGLPARTIPLEVKETTQVGLEVVAAAFAYGAASLHLLARERPRHDIVGLRATVATADRLLIGLGFGSGLVDVIETDDPDCLVEQLRSASSASRVQPGSFIAVGGKREVMRTALRELHRAAPKPVDIVALPAGAPFGRVAVDASGCTLCLSCVSACPTRALSDAADRPRLAFDESLCVQCGLCVATCPEKVMTIEPRLSFTAFEAAPVVLKEEAPFCCIRCAKPFGVKSTVERVTRALEAKHWMFSGENRARIDLVRMCEDCRVDVAVTSNVDPFAGPARPRVRTSEDYLAERSAKQREADMQRKIDKGEA